MKNKKRLKILKAFVAYPPRRLLRKYCLLLSRNLYVYSAESGTFMKMFEDIDGVIV